LTKNDIVKFAIELKETYKTNNPFKIAEILNIDYDFLAFRKDALQAYILKPYEDMQPFIWINSNFDEKSQQIFCAHELGHAVLHKNACNHFDGNSLTDSNEHEANLFAVALLFDPNLFIIDIQIMDNYVLKSILDFNVNYS
jgi:Zn-dependent peptidase ImmA (M78 family)